jgi:hypothetical protein
LEEVTPDTPFSSEREGEEAKDAGNGMVEVHLLFYFSMALAPRVGCALNLYATRSWIRYHTTFKHGFRSNVA